MSKQAFQVAFKCSLRHIQASTVGQLFLLCQGQPSLSVSCLCL